MWISVGINSEGIYRLSGNKTRVQKLILAFNQGWYWRVMQKAEINSGVL